MRAGARSRGLDRDDSSAGVRQLSRASVTLRPSTVPRAVRRIGRAARSDANVTRRPAGPHERGSGGWLDPLPPRPARRVVDRQPPAARQT